MSKYDEYWNKRIDDIFNLFDQADQIGLSNAIDVSDISTLGERDSWYGKAILRGNKLLNSKPMAHVQSLVSIIRQKKIIKNKLINIIHININFNLSNHQIRKPIQRTLSVVSLV